MYLHTHHVQDKIFLWHTELFTDSGSKDPCIWGRAFPTTWNKYKIQNEVTCQHHVLWKWPFPISVRRSLIFCNGDRYMSSVNCSNAILYKRRGSLGHVKGKKLRKSCSLLIGHLTKGMNLEYVIIFGCVWIELGSFTNRWVRVGTISKTTNIFWWIVSPLCWKAFWSIWLLVKVA
jgi:hypothetical protein